MSIIQSCSTCENQGLGLRSNTCGLCKIHLSWRKNAQNNWKQLPNNITADEQWNKNRHSSSNLRRI